MRLRLSPLLRTAAPLRPSSLLPSVAGVRAIHGKTGSTVPKTEANTGAATKTKHTQTNQHNTGDKGDGDMPHPKEYVDGLEPAPSGEVSAGREGASPTKKPTRSTGIKQGKKSQSEMVLSLCRLES